MNIEENMYGIAGWQEFLQNKKDLLSTYDIALAKNKNRPIRTSHGNAGEAAVRKWLLEFLPSKYGVTSGYIIPSIVCNDNNYKLYHYDIIIYDKLNSPILWVETDDDTSEQGKNRAIPAEYVNAVYEVKSKFSNKTAKESLEKLSELNKLSSYLPQNFHSGSIFFELNNGIIKKPQILDNYFKTKPYKFNCGVILRSELNPIMTGLINLSTTKKGDQLSNDLNLPLVKDINTLNIYKGTPLDEDTNAFVVKNPEKEGESENVVVAEPGAGIRALKLKAGEDWHYTKVYTTYRTRDKEATFLSWSNNKFTEFTIQLLKLLDGKKEDLNKLIFGQIFDKIKHKK